MKRLLSIILIVAICTSFVISTQGVNAADDNFSGEIVYNLIGDLKGGHLWNCTEDKISQYFSAPNWSFMDMSEIFSQIIADYPNVNTEGAIMTSGLSTTAINYAYSRMLNFSKGAYFRVVTVHNSYDYDISTHNPWFALKLDNPGEAGKYFFDIGKLDADTSQRITVWLAPYEDGKDDGEYYMTDENIVSKDQIFSTNIKSNDVTYPVDIKDDKTPYVCVMMFKNKAQDYRISSLKLKKQIVFDFRADSAYLKNNTSVPAIIDGYNPKSNWYYIDMHSVLKNATSENAEIVRVLVDKMQVSARAKNQWIALGLKGIDKGVYSADIEWFGRNTNASESLDIYVAKYEAGKSAESYMIDENLVEDAACSFTETDETITSDALSGKIVADGKSDYIFIIKSNVDDLKSFEPRKLALTSVKPDSLVLNFSESLKVGNSAVCSVIADGTVNATDAAVFKSDNVNVAKVTEDGKITAVGAGVATITATVSGFSVTREIVVTDDPYTLKYDFLVSSFEYNKMPRKSTNDSAYNGIRFTGTGINAEDLSDKIDNILIVNKSLLSWKKTLSVVTNLTDAGTKSSEPYYVMNSTFANGAVAKTEPWAFEYASATAINTRSNNYGLWTQMNVNKFVDTTTVTDHGSNTLSNAGVTPVFAMRLYIPNPGTYNVTFFNDNLTGLHYHASAAADVYFGKAPAATVTSSTIDSTMSSLEKIGVYFAPDAADKSLVINDKAITISQAGEYLLVFNMTRDTYNKNVCRVLSGNNKSYEYSNSRYLQYMIFEKIEFVPTEAGTDENVSSEVAFSVCSNITNVNVDVSGIDYNGKIDSVERGVNVSLTAPEVDGYKFRYWVRGSADNGKWVSGNEKYSFRLMTNTMLTAIYDKIAQTDEMQVEFWNQNGAYIETKNVENGILDAPTPTLTGYTFKNWYVDEDVVLDVTKLATAVTRAVARYEANAISGVKFNGEPESDVVYNKEITKCVPDAKIWYRDGKPVAYGDTYTYYVWSATNITYSTEAPTDKTPLVVIEQGNDRAWMIEYDAGDKQIVEAGIVFGNNATIGSCSAKATSQKITSHGQFTASSDFESARGYIIYLDGEEYKVIYSE